MTTLRTYVGLALLAVARAWEEPYGPSDFFTGLLAGTCVGVVALLALGVI